MTKDFVTERLKLKDLYPERAEVLSKEHDIDIEDLELIKKGVISEKIETVEKERAVISFINMETVDRDNEIIDPDGAILKHYNKTVPYGHDYRGLPMGKSMWIKKATKNGKRGLLAKTIFLKRPAINEELYHMFTDDVAGTGPALNSWSIGFIPLKWEELERKGEAKEGEADIRPRRKYTKWELLEYSGVMIPSNREALTEMVAKGLIKSEKLKEEIIECIGDECAIEGLDNDYDNVVYNSSDLITKPEETDDQIRIPVRDCKVTATITISEKQGITALYCGKIKKIRTYIFSKKAPYNWTMAKAKKWVEEHGKEVKIYETVNTLTDKEGIAVLYGGEEYYKDWDEKAKYNCECIKCGHKLTSDKHCKDLKCPKCGGTMRRVGRPGPGQESTDNLNSFDFLKDEREDIYGNGEVVELEENELEIQLDNAVIKLKNPLNSSDKSKLEKAWKELYESDPTYEDVTEFCKKWDVEVNILTKEELKQTEREQQITRELFDRTTEQLNKIEEELKSLKEGRVLSSKNRKLIQDCLASMEAAIPPLKTLLTATEPPKAEEVDLDLIKESPKQTDKKVNLNEQNVQDIVKNSLQTHFAKMIEEQEKTRKMIDKARGKVE